MTDWEHEDPLSKDSLSSSELRKITEELAERELGVNQVTIQQYHQQPNIREYFSHHHIEIEPNQKEYVNASIRLANLEMSLLPPSFVIFQNIASQLAISDAIFHNGQFKCSKNHQAIKLFLPTKHQTGMHRKSYINISPTTQAICSTQGLAFCLLDFQSFKRIFGDQLLEYQRQLEQLSSKNLVSDKMEREEIKEEDKGSDQEGIYSLVGKVKYPWLKYIFEQMCVAGYLLWPCSILQLINQHSNIGLQQLIQKSYHSSIQPQQQHIFQSVIAHIISKRLSSKKSQGSPFEGKHIQDKVKANIKTFQYLQPIVRLLGTKKVISTEVKLINWNLFTPKQIHSILNFSHFKYLITIISKLIRELNDFKNMQYVPSQNGLCVGRLCSNEDQEWMGIALKRNPRNNSNILVRILNNTQMFRWVDEKSLSVNLTVPPFNIQNITLGRVSNQLNVHKTLLFIQRYFSQEIHFQKVMRDEQRQVDTLCQKCLKPLTQQKSVQHCRFCESSESLKCLGQRNDVNLKLMVVEREMELDEQDMYSQDNVFVGNSTFPCELCKLLGDNSNIKCLKCHRLYHWQCQGSLFKQKGEKQFICQFCKKCAKCGKLTTGKQYHSNTDHQNICFCCYIDHTQTQLCHLCHIDLRQGDTITCQNNNCRVTVHCSCDGQMVARGSKGDTRYYWCPLCRLKKKRRVWKWVVEDLRKFDQKGYFQDPQQQINQYYMSVIGKSMCFTEMRDKVLKGSYDLDPYHSILTDLKSIVKNTMNINMPKDQPYYRAKILYIFGTKFLSQAREFIECSQFDIVTRDISAGYISTVRTFYQHLNNYMLADMLNYESQSVKIEYDLDITNKIETNNFDFDSRLIIKRQMERAIRIRVRMKKIPSNLGVMFMREKKRKVKVGIIKHKRCFYHPEERLRLIFQCDRCWQYFCCTRKCLRHDVCLRCPKDYCLCVRETDCKCDEDVSAELKQDVVERAKDLGLSIAEMTEYYKYCLKCTWQNLQNKICYICNRFCYYGYQVCQCGNCYHIICLGQKQWQIVPNQKYQLSRMSNDYHQIIIDNCCEECRDNNVMLSKYRDRSLQAVRFGTQRVIKIRMYSSLIAKILINQGKMIHSHFQLSKILQQNYQMLEILQRPLDELKKNQHYLNHLLEKETFSDIQFAYRQIKVETLLLGFTDMGREFLKRQQRNKGDSCSKFDEYLSVDQLIMGHRCCRKEKAMNDWWQEAQNGLNQIASGGQSQQSLSLMVYHYPSERGNKHAHQMKNQKMQKISLIYKYVKDMVAERLEGQKRAFKCGNTSILQASHGIWKCVKNYQGQNYQFCLRKVGEQWTFAIDQVVSEVRFIREILEQVRQVGPAITTQNQLMDFLGFDISIQSETYYPYSKLILNFIPQEMQRKQRKQILDEHFRATQKDNKESIQLTNRNKLYRPFYLSKRKGEDNKKQEMRELPKMKISLSDLEYDLDELSEEDQQPINRQYTEPIKIQSEQIHEPLMASQGQSDESQRQSVDSVLSNSSQSEDCVFQKVYCEAEQFLFVGPSTIDRLGLFPSRSIPRMTVVTQYIGEMISEAVADFRQRQNNLGCYMFRLDKGTGQRAQIIDATFMGNMARYINHSCNANCKAEMRQVGTSEFKIVIFTVREVGCCEELTYDYQFRKDSSEGLECKCGAPNCQKRLT